MLNCILFEVNLYKLNYFIMNVSLYKKLNK